MHVASAWRSNRPEQRISLDINFQELQAQNPVETHRELACVGVCEGEGVVRLQQHTQRYP
jgi:hypothetical protein